MSKCSWFWYRVKNTVLDLIALGPLGYWRARAQFRKALREFMESEAVTIRSKE